MTPIKIKKKYRDGKRLKQIGHARVRGGKR